MKPLFEKKNLPKSCQSAGLRLVSLQTLNASNKTSGRLLIKVALLTTAGFLVAFTALWFGIAFAPLLVARNDGLRTTAQPGTRPLSTNTFGELLSDGRTFVSAFRYVIQPERSFTLVQTGFPTVSNPLGTFSNSAAMSVSNTWRAAKDPVNADG